MSKTPYEVRAEILEMAQRHLEQQYFANLEFARKIFDKSLDGMDKVGFKNAEELLKYQQEMFLNVQKSIPQMPTIEEITKKANELYAFVTKKE